MKHLYNCLERWLGYDLAICQMQRAPRSCHNQCRLSLPRSKSSWQTTWRKGSGIQLPRLSGKRDFTLNANCMRRSLDRWEQSVCRKWRQISFSQRPWVFLSQGVSTAFHLQKLNVFPYACKRTVNALQRTVTRYHLQSISCRNGRHIPPKKCRGTVIRYIVCNIITFDK